MLFNSLHFLFFFPIVTAAYFALPDRARISWLLLASCYFYMVFRPVYILILVLTIVIDYSAGLLLEHAEGRRRAWVLGLSIAANVGVLAFFKYYDFLASNTGSLAMWLGWHTVPRPLHLLLPIGLSFHTFQSLSYTIEVYRRKQPAEHRFLVFALYVMFYPQLVAGPIERPQNLLPQFDERHRWNGRRVMDGLGLMVWGLFKKVAIADMVAPVVNAAYADPVMAGRFGMLLATVLFAFQIYCDFSGYSDVAIGSAQVMGFRLMDNFNRPYAARSMSEFWTRWHISLSTWFKDYVYIPLGGSRVSMARYARNVMVTFALSGLWHGANWTFVVWGLLNGSFLLLERLTGSAARYVTGGRALPKVLPTKAASRLVVFGAACLGWVFFRAPDMAHATATLRTIFGPGHTGGSWRRLFDAVPPWVLATGLISLAVMEWVHWRRAHTGVREFVSGVSLRETVVTASLVAACFLLIAIGWASTGVRPTSAFIYFQF